jgi:hypothetical protein
MKYRFAMMVAFSVLLSVTETHALEPSQAPSCDQGQTKLKSCAITEDAENNGLIKGHIDTLTICQSGEQIFMIESKPGVLSPIPNLATKLENDSYTFSYGAISFTLEGISPVSGSSANAQYKMVGKGAMPDGKDAVLTAKMKCQ